MLVSADVPMRGAAHSFLVLKEIVKIFGCFLLFCLALGFALQPNLGQKTICSLHSAMGVHNSKTVYCTPKLKF